MSDVMAFFADEAILVLLLSIYKILTIDRFRPAWLGRQLPAKSVFIRDALRGVVGKAGIGGDYLEFGVYRGDSLGAAFKGADAAGLRGMRFFGFDTFAGLPASDDAAEAARWATGSMMCSRQDALANLRRQKVDTTRVRLVEGRFEQTLTDELREELGISAAAVVYIDCDQMSGALAALRFVTPILQPGTLLLVDDWSTFLGSPDRGAQGAVRTWMREVPHLTLSHFRSVGNNLESFFVRPSGEDAGPSAGVRDATHRGL